MSRYVALYFSNGREVIDPVFERICTKCHRFVPAASVKGSARTVGEGFNAGPQCTATGECKRCGTVPLDHIGWMGDFMEDEA